MKLSELLFRFLIAVFFSLLIMLADSFSWLGWFRAAVETIYRPETDLLSSASAAVNQTASSARYLVSGPARVADLERRLAAAEREAISSARSQEKTDVSSIPGWATERGFSLIPVQVLSSGAQLIIEIPPADIIDKPVLSPDGALLGSVASIGRFSARVKLLSDSTSQIPVAILTPDKQKKASGILTGSFGTSLMVEKILTEVNLEPDLAVVTTGENDLFPPDLLIGWIGKTGPKQVSSLYQKAEVIPAAKPSEMKVVFIIL